VAHARRRGAFGIALLISAVILFLPASDVPHTPGQTDKVVHVAMFAILVLAGLRAFLPAAWLGVALIIYGGLAELAQSLPGIRRSTDALDWLADGVGVLVGTALYVLAVYAGARRRR
jgi:hypothetical protein